MSECEMCNQLRLERDEAREVAAGLLAHLEAAWEVVGDQAQVISHTIAVQKKEVTHSAHRFYPWLKKQASVDEEED